MLAQVALASVANPIGSDCGDYFTSNGTRVLPWSELSDQRPHHREQAARWGNQNVFIKFICAPSWPDCFSRVRRLDALAVVLEAAGVGPKYYGFTFSPEHGRFMQVFEFIDGEPSRTLPEDFPLRAEHLITVDRAVSVLNEAKIDARDLQFLMTRPERSVLIDYDEFRLAPDSAEAKSYNRARHRKLKRDLARTLKSREKLRYVAHVARKYMKRER